MKLLERAGILLASLALSAGLIALLSGYFTRRDQGSVSGTTSVAGQRFRDLGDAILKPGQRRPTYDSDPPTSGAHFPEPVTRDLVRLNEDQLLEALAAGDVVIAYSEGRPPAGLTTLARALAPPFSPALARAGQAVILAPRPATAGLIGLAWAHMVRVRVAADPRLREFAAFWLGRGTPRR